MNACVEYKDDLKLSPKAEEEIKRYRARIEEHDQRIKDLREAIANINKDLVEVQQEIIIRMGKVIDLNHMKKDREKEIMDAYRDRDYSYQEINDVRNCERQRQRLSMGSEPPAPDEKE